MGQASGPAGNEQGWFRWEPWTKRQVRRGSRRSACELTKGEKKRNWARWRRRDGARCGDLRQVERIGLTPGGRAARAEGTSVRAAGHRCIHTGAQPPMW